MKIGPDEVRSILRGASAQSCAAGIPSNDLDALQHETSLMQIVGRWPPTPELPVPREEAQDIADRLERARHQLAEAQPGTAELEGLDALTTHLQAHIAAADVG